MVHWTGSSSYWIYVQISFPGGFADLGILIKDPNVWLDGASHPNHSAYDFYEPLIWWTGPYIFKKRLKTVLSKLKQQDVIFI
jgi:hypothetical protein